MGDPYVREIGSVETSDGAISVGVDYDTVAFYIGGWLSADGVRLSGAKLEEFGRLYVAACWQAGWQQRVQDEDGGVSGARPSSGPGPDPARDQLAAGDSGGLAPAASPIEGMSAAEFERRLRELMRANPRLLETFLRQAARRAGRPAIWGSRA